MATACLTMVGAPTIWVSRPCLARVSQSCSLIGRQRHARGQRSLWRGLPRVSLQDWRFRFLRTWFCSGWNGRWVRSFTYLRCIQCGRKSVGARRSRDDESSHGHKAVLGARPFGGRIDSCPFADFYGDVGVAWRTAIGRSRVPPGGIMCHLGAQRHPTRGEGLGPQASKRQGTRPTWLWAWSAPTPIRWDLSNVDGCGGEFFLIPVSGTHLLLYGSRGHPCISPPCAAPVCSYISVLVAVGPSITIAACVQGAVPLRCG